MVSVELQIGSIIICVLENGDLWLMRPDGEGMQVGAVELEKLLLDHYEGNF